MNLKKIFSCGVSEIIGEKELRKKLESDPSKVVIKYGIDPTRPDIHLGHAVCLRKLREFQDLGCKVVFLIGDFTARIGDPTGKSKIRPEIDFAEVEANTKTYLNQIGNILETKDNNKFVWVRNSDWYYSMNDLITPDNFEIPIPAKNEKGEKATIKVRVPANHFLAKAQAWNDSRQIKGMTQNVSLICVLNTLKKITHSRLIERDLFQERIKSGEPLFMHEMLYPVLQGIDSYVVSGYFGKDSFYLELGGTDQHFNMLMGREVMEMNLKKPQAVMTLPILEGTDGKEKMSKSLENCIGITEPSREIFGKTMRIPDSLIPRWVELCTDLDSTEFEKRLKKENPRNLKAELAKELVKIYHGLSEADKAVEEFKRMFSGKSGGGQPDVIPEIQIEEGSWGIVELLSAAKLVDSKSDARRLIQQGGVRVNDSKVEKVETNFEVGRGELILQIGKRRWAKIIA